MYSMLWAKCGQGARGLRTSFMSANRTHTRCIDDRLFPHPPWRSGPSWALRRPFGLLPPSWSLDHIHLALAFVLTISSGNPPQRLTGSIDAC